MVTKISDIFEKILSNDYSRSFLIYSIFRAIYGPFILLITYVFATEFEDGIYYSILILITSMIFSRLLFSRIKIWLNLEKNLQPE